MAINNSKFAFFEIWRPPKFWSVDFFGLAQSKSFSGAKNFIKPQISSELWLFRWQKKQKKTQTFNLT